MIGDIFVKKSDAKVVKHPKLFLGPMEPLYPLVTSVQFYSHQKYKNQITPKSLQTQTQDGGDAEGKILVLLAPPYRENIEKKIK